MPPKSEPQDLPDHYENLDLALREAWSLLSAGVQNGRSPFHTPSVATAGRNGIPTLRTVVLRAVDPLDWTLRFHTDGRSGKCDDLLEQPVISLHVYDAANKVQVRCQGLASVHLDDDVADEAWQSSLPQARVCYAQVLPPGTLLAVPGDADPAGACDSRARLNFAAVSIAVHELEWLYLCSSGHRRARFLRTEDGSIASTWLAP